MQLLVLVPEVLQRLVAHELLQDLLKQGLNGLKRA